MTHQRFEPGLATGRRQHEVSVNRKKKIGGGFYGDVFLADVHMTDGHTERHRQMVVKAYRSKDSAPGKERQLAQRAMHNYGLAKAAGLRVFPTFRLSPEGNSILMTLANTEAWICVGTNEGSDSVQAVAGTELSVEPNGQLETFINQVLDQAELAKRASLSLDSDMIFVLIDRAKRNKMDYVFGDMDMVTQWPREMLKNGGDQQLYQTNLAAMYASLHIFFAKNTKIPKPYFDLLDKAFAEHRGDRAVLARIDATTQPRKRPTP